MPITGLRKICFTSQIEIVPPAGPDTDSAFGESAPAGPAGPDVRMSGSADPGSGNGEGSQETEPTTPGPASTQDAGRIPGSLSTSAAKTGSAVPAAGACAAQQRRAVNAAPNQICSEYRTVHGRKVG